MSGLPDGDSDTRGAAALVITVDGPSGSGKSTVARATAAQLGWRYVDTGATYRAVTLAVLRAAVDVTDTDAVAAVARQGSEQDALQLDTSPAGGGVSLYGEDVSTAVRSPEVTAAVSAVSAVPEVRELLVALQRRSIGTDGAVAEGRDVGSVVVPGAAVKIFLDADPAVRASRRAAQGESGVSHADPSQLLQAVADDLRRRDQHDSSRVMSPLRPAADAVHLDASHQSVDEVTEAVLQLARDAGLAPA